MKKFFYLLFFTVVLPAVTASCTRSDVYNEYADLPHARWHQDSAIHFDVNIADTVSYSDILINIRHTGGYPYQNLWMFVHSYSPSGRIQRDTIACYLADNHGRWLGTRYPSTFEMPVLYMQRIRFPEPGVYRFDIYQAMRDSIIGGVRNIGLQVRTEQEEN
ncbi:MAG: gliding motility lipoprotein GldH [Paludibacteraceae bacterium]|nr:gliding motility lipoprotein GldH [Paludibacteraceae bacterium]